MVRCHINTMPSASRTSPDEAPCQPDSAAVFYRLMFPHAQPTPLVELPALASKAGIGRVLLKDESCFLNLNSFKARGSLWAMAKIMAQKTGLHSERITPASLNKKLAGRPPFTFITATDGNHGRGVAWAARQFGQKARVFMPRGASPQRVMAIRELDAECIVLDTNYDAAVRHAASVAEQTNSILLQDTAWPGYEEIPALIMQGYGIMVLEIAEQLKKIPSPCAFSHVFLQAGVGSFAAAVISAFKLLNMPQPLFISLEPENAACVFKSLQNGQRQRVKGDLDTIMAGLACGETSSLAWPILRDNLFAACAIPDRLAETGIRALAAENVYSGESGAPGAGFLIHAASEKNLQGALGLDENSTALLFSTEGVTDRQNWEKIMENGVI